MTMTQTPTFVLGHSLAGLDIGARLNGTDKSVTLGNVQFDRGSGFTAVASANATYKLERVHQQLPQVWGRDGRLDAQRNHDLPDRQRGER